MTKPKNASSPSPPGGSGTKVAEAPPADLFRMLVEGIADYGIALLDAKGRILTWNAGAERMTGYRADEAIGQPVSLFYPPEEIASGHVDRELARAAREGRVEDENWRSRKDGTRFWGNTVITAIREPSGELRGFSRVTRDLTARHRSEVFLHSVLDYTMDGIISIDEEGRIESMNRSAERMFGYAEHEVIGKNVTLLMPAEYQQEHVDSLAHYLLTGEAKIIGIGREVEGLRKDGTEFPMDIAITEFQFEGRHHFTGILRDITERKRLEQQLWQAQKMEAVGQLAGGIAHDFNNILMVIQGHAHILLQGMAQEDPRQQSVREIRQAGERAAALTRQLLAFSRRQLLQMRLVDLNAVIRDMEGMLRRLIGEDVELSVLLTPTTRHVRIDPGQMEQVLLNLVLNARDAMPDGGQLSVETHDVNLDETYVKEHSDARSGLHVVLAVTDSGHGMDEQTRQRIFDPFFTTKGAGHGTGLGLAMVYGIVRQFGGSIEVYSERGHGSAFKIYLPALEEDGRPAPAETVPGSYEGPETILLVEDEEPVRRICSIALRSHGYDVIAAASGREALRLAEEHGAPVDLLLTDLVMPDMNGRELAEKMRAADPALKIVYMSGYTDDAVVRHGLLDPEAAFLSKPCTPTELARKVRETLDRATE